MVTKLSCMGGLKFEMATDAGPLTLHISPGANFQIRLSTKPSGPFNPCTAIQGQRVKVEYQPDGAKGKTGTVESLTVLSGTSDMGRFAKFRGSPAARRRFPASETSSRLRPKAASHKCFATETNLL